MRKTFTLALLALFCICGFAQTIDPVLLQEMGQRTDDEKIKVVVIMKSQYDRQQLDRRAAQYSIRADRRTFVVNELKRFAETSQHDLRVSLNEMESYGMTTAPTTLWMANALYFSATKQAINDLAMRRDIEIIGLDEKRHAVFNEESTPATMSRGITSNVTQVNANQVWDLGYTGRGVVVAVVDSGVNYNHLDLADHLWDGGSEYPYHGFDFYNNDYDPMDDYGHGTHCAGTVCGDGTSGSQTGMAPDATLMCVKVIDEYGDGYASLICNALQWTVEQGCDLISMSLGWANASITERTLYRNTCVAVMNAGVIGVFPAGDLGNYQYYCPVPNNVSVPGSCPPPYMDSVQEYNAGGLSCALSVGAVNGNDYAYYYTSIGPVTWSNTAYADYPYVEGSSTEFGLIRPDVCAPGVDIASADYSSNSGYAYYSGTAMASSCVAGCISLLMSKNINATPAEICQVLEETAVSSETGKSNTYGYGRVDALAAINALHSGPLTLESFAVNDGQGNNDGKLNAGETATFDLTLLNDSEIALDGATLLLSTESEYVTITNGTATLPHFNAGQTQTIENIFDFTLSNDAPAKNAIQFSAEIFSNGESLGIVWINVMVYGHLLSLDEVTVLNDGNGNGSLEAGETANLHIAVSNNGNEPATSVVGTLSTSYPYLVINSNDKSFGTINVDGQASANFNVSLANGAPNSYTIDFSLDLVDASAKHSELEFELWRKAITLTSNPVGAGTLSGGGSYGEGQTCTITATANNNYAFVSWTLNGEVVSYLPTYSFIVTDAAEYVANFQRIDGIVVGEATGFNYYLPTYSYYPYSLSQQIYTASEMGGQACQITSVSFFNSGSAKTRNLTVYMVNTSKTSFASNTDWITVVEANKMFSGSVSLAANGWATIYFAKPFNYNGVSNIALIIDDNTGSWNSGLLCRTYGAAGNQAIYVCSSGTNYDANNPSNYNGNLMSQKNQVVFGFARYNYTVTAAANPTAGGTVSGNTGLHYYGQAVTLTATANDGYVFNNWTKNGEVVSYLSTYSFPTTETAQYVANFGQVDGIAIGDAVSSNSYLPTYSYYPFTLSQQIYTADEMGGEAQEISSVSFFNTGSAKTRKFDIYLVHTDKAVFESTTDWITVTEDDKVFSGSVTITANDWTTIYFNKAFNYSGSSNVALIVDDNTQSWNSGLSCRTFGTDANGNQTIRINGSGTNYNPCNPTGYTGTLMSQKNQVVFGFPSYQYTVTATANPIEGGTVSGGEGYYFQGQSCTLTATANEGFCFYNWTVNGSIVSSDATYTFPVMDNMNLVANFGEPITITATAAPNEGGTVSGGGSYGLNQICTLTATPSEGYVFSKWLKNGYAVSGLPTYSFTVTSAAEYVAQFLQVDGIAIGEPTLSNTQLPTYGYNSLTQQIYTADELNAGSCEISSVSFFSFGYEETRNLTIYMVNTTKTAFDDENDWITVSAADLVFSGSVNMSYYNWSTVYFIAPFIYDGSSNVALIIYDSSNEWIGYSCRTFYADGMQALGYYDCEGGYDPNSFTAYSGTLMSVKNQIILGLPNYEYTASAWANPEEGGTVNGGGGLYYYGQPIPFTATPNPGYVFNYWAKFYSDQWSGYEEVVSYLSTDYLPVEGNVDYMAQFQPMDGIIVGGANHTNRYLPTNSEYPYSLTQQIYTADELNTGECEISSVSFFNTGYYITRDLAVYMVNTTKNKFDSFNDWINVTDEDLVFSGIVNADETSWMTIYFNTPFNYDGSSNVALVIYDQSWEWNWGLSCRTFNTQNTQAIYAFDEYPINPHNPIAVSTLLSEKNQIVFGVASYDYTLTLLADPEEGGTVSGGGGTYFYGQPVPVTATANPGYVFNYWTKYIDDDWYEYEEVVSYLSSDVLPVEGNDYVAHFQQMDGIVIGDAIHVRPYLPINSDFPYSYTQQIYTAEEMNTEACEISSVSFFNAGYYLERNLTIYMVNTTKTMFSDMNDWINVTDADIVFSGMVSWEEMNWKTIYFNTPFNYDGSSNVALVICCDDGEWYSGVNCRTFDTPTPQAIYALGDYDYTINPNDPEISGWCVSEKNQVVFGIADYNYWVSVSANPTAGGTVSGGGGPYYYGQPIPLSATTNNGYVFSTWTKDNEVVSCFPDFTLSVTDTAECVANFKPVEGILIGESAQANTYLQTYGYNSLMEQIYTAAEMGGQPRQISSVSLFNTGDGRTRNLTLYMVNTDKTAFASRTDWITITDDDPVLYSGNVAIPAKGWVTINFATPFNYDGLSNVALIIDDNSSSYNYEIRYRAFDTEDSQVLHVYNYSSSTDIDPYHLSGTGNYSTLMSVKSQVVFGFPDYIYTVTATANPAAYGTVSGGEETYYLGQSCTLTATPNAGYYFYNWTRNGTMVSTNATYTFPVTGNMELVANFGLPVSITATTNFEEGGVITGAGNYGYSQTCTLTATANEGYVFSRWTLNGTPVSYLSTYSFTVTTDAEYVAVFDRVYPNIAIGEAESTHYSLPSRSGYRYTLSQQIYTAEEIGTSCEIYRISFFNTGNTKTRNYTIYMKHTDKTAFESSRDWITVDESDQVFSGTVTMTSKTWTEITFDSPFHYNGTSNLVLIIDDNTGSWSSGMTCRVFNTENSQALFTYSDGTNYDPYDPTVCYGSLVRVKNQIIFGTTLTQTSTLSQGWNWWSTNLDITMDDLKAALLEALPNAAANAIKIKSQRDGQATWNGRMWTGQLKNMDVVQMYKINVPAACEITLTGMPINPAEHPVAINEGSNWIGYPLSESMTVTNAFAGFAVNNDAVKSAADGQASWNGRMWMGTLKNLVPGKGYIYKSNATGSRTFTFPTSAK